MLQIHEKVKYDHIFYLFLYTVKRIFWKITIYDFNNAEFYWIVLVIEFCSILS